MGFHQDDSYNEWIVPGEMLTCWITLDDTRADQGTIEYVRGSHRWPIAPPIKQFHAPDDPLDDLGRAAAGAGIRNYEFVRSKCRRAPPSFITAAPGTARATTGATGRGAR